MRWTIKAVFPSIMALIVAGALWSEAMNRQVVRVAATAGEGRTTTKKLAPTATDASVANANYNIVVDSQKAVSSILVQREEEKPAPKAINVGTQQSHGASSTFIANDQLTDTKEKKKEKDPPTITATTSQKFHHDKIFIIGAGRGTTGTHLMFETTCHLGFASHHYNFGCIPQNDTISGSNQIPPAYRQARAVHMRLLKRLAFVQQCVGRQKRKCGSALQWMQSTVKAIRDLVAEGHVVALHDNPYPFLMPALLPMAQRYYPQTVVLLSERDPATYAARRSGISNGRSDLFCRDYHPVIDNVTLAGGAFDLLGCVSRALSKARTVHHASRLDLSQVFTSLKYLVQDQGQEVAHALIANETAKYQRAIRQIADFSLDMFARDGRTAKESLADELAANIPAIARYRQRRQQQQQQPAHYVNWWRQTLVPDLGRRGPPRRRKKKGAPKM